ncbi:MAG: DUF1573 domain-containing protein [Prolixibacteraceae bacterium]|jgi:hypothetical protein|nr:DUF1573 domain-containing protein [Prolixibacteraceae bacterium]
MRYSVQLLTAALLLLVGLNAGAQTTADMVFESLDHDFGKIKEDAGSANFNFNFKNNGKVPLVISTVSASCGCTTPEWSKEPILPGKTGFIKVSYNPMGRPGSFNKTITVMANIPNGAIVLKIAGDVLPKSLSINEQYPIDLGKIRLLNNNLSFVRIKNNEKKTDSLKFINTSGAKVTIGLKGVLAHLTVKINPAVVEPNGIGYIVVTFDGSKVGELGFQMARVYLTYNGEENYNYGINVTATVEEDFSKMTQKEIQNAPIIDFNERVYDFGEIKEGKKVEYTFKIINKGKSDLQIRSVKASCGCTAANPTSNVIKSGKDTDLKVVFDSTGKLGLQSKTITIISNDPNQSTSILRISGNVSKAQ